MIASLRHSVPVLLALAAAFTLSWPVASAGQDYPSKTMRIVVPFGAGGPADVYSRQLAQYLSESLKQSFVVENRPGAGSIIGSDAVAKSRARRLHAADDVEHPHHQRIAHAQQAVPADARLRAGSGDQLFRSGDGDTSVRCRERSEGVHRAGEVETRRAQLCVFRSRAPRIIWPANCSKASAAPTSSTCRTRRPARCATASSAVTCKWHSMRSLRWHRT